MAASFGFLYLVNIYTRSGNSRRRDSEQFFNEDLTYLPRTILQHFIMRGGSKCDLISTGVTNSKRVLHNLLQGWDVVNSWKNRPLLTGIYPLFAANCLLDCQNLYVAYDG